MTSLAFLFQFYWSGLRLITFIGYKILNHIDMDSFEENVLVAVGGLSTGLASELSDGTQLLLLARFLISVVTICARDCEHSTEAEQRRPLRSACRLLVEYLAVLVKQLNRLTGPAPDQLADRLLFGGTPVDVFKFLRPVLVLAFWMSRCPLFFEVEVWKRKWSFDTNFLADLWPELAALGNKVSHAQQEGLFSYISYSGTPRRFHLFGRCQLFRMHVLLFYGGFRIRGIAHPRAGELVRLLAHLRLRQSPLPHRRRGSEEARDGRESLPCRALTLLSRRRWTCASSCCWTCSGSWPRTAPSSPASAAWRSAAARTRAGC